MKLKTWKKLSEKVISKNNHWSYHLDEFEIEGITRSEYHYVHSLVSTMVIPPNKKWQSTTCKSIQIFKSKRKFRVSVRLC
ncbi:MAG: hypothetical protein H6613_17875 [Ignavibacteriales bacterium]|nr:hypothetical protein [Ignavibacteriales bacterium]